MHSSRLFQGIALLVGIGLLLVALGIWFAWPGVLQLWIWPKTPPLGCAFVAAMLAGGAAPLVWIGLSGHLAAIRAPMLTGVVANAGIALHLFANHTRPSNERYLPFAALFAIGSLVAAIVFAFLVYDLFTIPPYLNYLASVDPPFQNSLNAYLAVLFASTIFCGYFLLVDPRTRFIARGRAIAPTSG